jgi:hypothetical protein
VIARADRYRQRRLVAYKKVLQELVVPVINPDGLPEATNQVELPIDPGWLSPAQRFAEHRLCIAG